MTFTNLKLFRILAAACSLLLLSMLGAPRCAAQAMWTPDPNTRGLELSIGSVSSPVRVGDSIPIVLSLSNHSGKYMRVWYTPLHDRLRVYIRDQRNTVVPMKKGAVFPGLVGQGRPIPVDKDFPITLRVDATQYGQISQRGTYTISACLDVGFIVCSNNATVVVQ